MQREWNPRSFFCGFSPHVVIVLSKRLGLVLTPEDGSQSGARVYRAWKLLAASEQRRIEAVLLPINNMCTPDARPFLEAAARRAWTNACASLVEASRAWSVQDLAARLYVDDANAFHRAYESFAVDSMEHAKEFLGRYPIRVEARPDHKERLRGAMQAHFRQTSLGARCEVEDFVDDESLALFVYYEDELTLLDRFTDAGSMARDWQRPVIHLSAVFHFATATLHVKGARDPEREKLRDLFAEIFIGSPSFFENPLKNPKFCFDALRDPAFQFATLGHDHIEDVSLVKLVFRPTHDDVQGVTVDLKPGLTVERVHNVLDGRGIDVLNDRIDGVQLRFRFDDHGRHECRTVSLFTPNTSNLGNTDRDRVIRRYLQEWGIDEVRAASVAPLAD